MLEILFGRIELVEHEWSVAVVSSREKPEELMATIRSICDAAKQDTVIDVMVNGNQSLALAISNLLAAEGEGLTCETRVWSIPLGGKAHAWNHYVHLVWPGAKLAFFVDGYVKVASNSLQVLANGISSSGAIAGTGVPSSGRTAGQLKSRMLNEGGLHGNLFALTRNAMSVLRSKGFRLPLGLYGFDTVLGAVVGFGLDPAKNDWNPKERIFACADVTWTNPEKKWWRYSDVRGQFNRTLSNALRVLVREATKYFFARQKIDIEKIPATVEEFVLTWARDCPTEVRATLLKAPVSYLALDKLRQSRDWSAAVLPPKLIFPATDKEVDTELAHV